MLLATAAARRLLASPPAASLLVGGAARGPRLLARVPIDGPPPALLLLLARPLWAGSPPAAAAATDSGGSSPTSRRYSERKLIGYTPAQIYGIVADVGSYADFVPWCVRSTVLEKAEEEEEGEGEEGPAPPTTFAGPPAEMRLEAELEVGFRAFSERYTSVVILRPGGLATELAGGGSSTAVPVAAAAAAAAATPATITSTVRGSTLFHHLDCSWAFSPGPAPGTAWLTFGIAFEFKSPLYRAVAAAFFDEVVRRMVAAFEGRCGAVHGGPSVSTAARRVGRVGVVGVGRPGVRLKRPAPAG